MSTFKALRVHHSPSGPSAAVESISTEQLSPGAVRVRVAYSGLNYKDALAITGRGAIMRSYPRVAGIDLSGVIESSEDPAWRPGERVLATGAGLGEWLDGGLAEYARLPAEALVPLPAGLTLLEAMALGTAGFTAALALRRMLENHQDPARGPIAVSGASGGVGGIALLLLKQAGFQTAAITGKPEAAPQLQELGADEVIDRGQLDLGAKPLEKAIWGGAVDNLGGEVLTYLTRTVKPWGNIACIGLAQSATLATTVMPLILRGVSLLGIHSVQVPRPWRLALWEQLAGPWRPQRLEQRIVRAVIGLEQVPQAARELVAGQARGRYVVRLAGDL
ncbi:MAG: acryloyl-CoA reductase [Steroidobacteraceae bacterium]